MGRFVIRKGCEMSVRDILFAASGGSVPSDSDPYFSNTVLLLHGDGTNGAQNNTFVDSSPNNFTITRNGKTTQGTFSPFSKEPGKWGAYFDGSGDYLSIAHNAAFNFGTGDFTIEMWVNPTSLGNNPFLFQKTTGGGVTAGWLVELSASGGVWFGGGTSGFANWSSAAVPTGSWTHLAFTRVGSNLTAFKNGVSLGSQSVGTASGSVDNTAAVQIGAWANYQAGYEFNGAISNLRVIKGTALYTANFTPSTTPLTAVTNTSLLLNFTNAGIIDNSGKNDLETVGNAQISTSVKKFGTGAMYFDGSGDALKRAPNSLFSFGTGDFTVEGWFYQTADNTYPSALEINNHLGTGGILFITKTGGNASVYAADTGGGAFVAPQATTLNQWNHIAWVRSNGVLRTYVNGVSTSSANFTLNVQCTTSLTMGAEQSLNATYTYPGYIDDLRITKGVARYTANFAPPAQSFPNK